MPQKLIVIMIDGISAEYFSTCRGRLPHLSTLAERGLVVNSLHSEVLGTSMPGRVSMMTGVTADVSGAYGNLIWDGERFRYVNPDDIRVPTLPARALSAGLDVAVFGFGMIRPEDAAIFLLPWWVGLYIQRARDTVPQPSDLPWLRVYNHQDGGERFNAMCAAVDFPSRWPSPTEDNTAESFQYGLMCDYYALNWTGIAAASPDAPDLIITEFLTTDTVQHDTGYKSDTSHWAISQADAMVGVVIERLRSAGVEGQWNIAVMSDHGHSPIQRAIRPQVIIPGTPMQSEGGILNVVPRDADDLARITQALAPYGVQPFHTDYVPEDLRGQVASFLAPDGMTFEPDDPDETEPVGAPRLLSSHGLRPGNPADDRFAVFAGPDVEPGIVESANAVQVAPTLAALLRLPLDEFPADPVFHLSGAS
jgi:predicted AlkP superfamily pyrophosphatase or phosphodiesterase